MIDIDGYRANVGIVLCNSQGQLLWARRIGRNEWQFPQGGIKHDETPEQALYRELGEEIGLKPQHVSILGNTLGWLYYKLPKWMVRRGQEPLCIGQKQVWYLLKLCASESAICLDRFAQPEFDRWRWVGYWQPLEEVVSFKREVYMKALHELAPLLNKEKIKKVIHKST
ncbi:MAG: RNA pyrophosphohydrolase [Thiohalomonadales bacterium]